jgi:hypothetical protein
MILDIEKLPVRELVWESKNTRFYADTLLFHYTVLPYDEKGQYEWRAFDGETDTCRRHGTGPEITVRKCTFGDALYFNGIGL